MSDKQRQAQFVEAYLRHRFSDRLDHFERSRKRYSAAHTWTVALAAALFIAAAAAAAIGMADGPRRAMWGFAATTLAALGTAMSLYEATFGFRRLARESATTSVALQRLAVDGPTPEDVDDERLVAFVTEVESVLRYGR
ncbi:SLATT domain-containing protein [Lentzea sp. CC55]|uniref:SLATT domain-containing protein n=1 Tax=Lentzea sp. CC55 TaxID=2884909 RepID=UPI001F1BA3E5|nr:SLATT domain-containing protein [Lentzea sp. CC55]MCG8923435.1 SLATT domain-containing protein [Lentzea sp. CC55]